MIQSSNIKISVFIWIFLIGLSCNKSETPNFSMAANTKNLLEDHMTYYVEPLSKSLSSHTNQLLKATKAFTAKPTLETLSTVKEKWKQAAADFVAFKPIDYGPAETSKGSYVVMLGSYPVKTDSIEARINRAFLNTSDFNFSSRGFYGIEYLLFSRNAQETVNYFKTVQNANRYLETIADDLDKKTKAITTAWIESKHTFTTNHSTSSGSPISNHYNTFVSSYETLKNSVGSSVGRKVSSLSKTKNNPTKVEAFYSGETLALMKSTFEAIKKIWYGQSWLGNQNTFGFKDYLTPLVNGKDIVEDIIKKLEQIDDALENLPTDKTFSETIEAAGENGKVESIETLFEAMSRATSSLKSRMSSAMGINITYMDGDGD